MFASKSAIASLNSPKAGSRAAKGKSEGPIDAPTVGVDCDARRLVREGGRNGVVGREGIVFPAPERERECEDVLVCAFTVTGVVEAAMVIACQCIRGDSDRKMYSESNVSACACIDALSSTSLWPAIKHGTKAPLLASRVTQAR